MTKEEVAILTNDEVKKLYQSAVQQHKAKFPTFGDVSFNEKVKGYTGMRRVLCNGVSAENKRQRKSRKWKRFLDSID